MFTAMHFFTAESVAVCVRHQARFMGAVATAQVPKITVIVGNSFGPQNFMMVIKLLITAQQLHPESIPFARKYAFFNSYEIVLKHALEK